MTQAVCTPTTVNNTDVLYAMWINRAIWFNALGIGSLLLMCAYAGLTIFAYYYLYRCDPLSSGQVDNRDQLFPLFVMQVLGDAPCVPGLFVAGVFSGSLSTVSSGLNALAGVTLVDYVQGYLDVELSEKTAVMAAKALAIIYGGVCYGFVYMVKYLPGVLEVEF